MSKSIMPKHEKTVGIVLLAHGARDPRWREPFDKILEMLIEHSGTLASLSFLDHMEPKFLYACQEVIKAGANEIVVVPLFIGAGGHVRQDVPELVREAERETGVSITVTQAIGEQTEVLRAIAETSLNLIGAIHK